MPEEYFQSHFALDIGAVEVTRFLSERLQLPAVLAGYSRLMVDCNRRFDDPTAFPDEIDGLPVPGNADLTLAERQARADALYWPYHHAVRDQLAALETQVSAPVIIAIHSFTPVLNGQERQNYPVSDMVFPPPLLVSLVSQDMTLNPGDVIACGTSIGVGSMKEPSNLVEVTIEGIGTLSTVYEN